MAHYQLHETQIVHAPIKDVWGFISSPLNLKQITPPHMGFDITSKTDVSTMYEGMIITYNISPFKGYKTNWVTEITHIKENELFVDEQRVGPYKLWHHQHHIKPHPDGTLMEDIITYEPPFGPLGIIANKLIIRKQLKQIFSYRKQAIENIFSTNC